MDAMVSQGWRARMRRTRVGALTLKVVVFVAGSVCIVMGLVLLVLPGPLTIPPVLLGLYLWSTEFAWAERLRDVAMGKARVAWGASKRRPIHTAAVTLTGLGLAGVAVYLGHRAHVLDRLADALG